MYSGMEKDYCFHQEKKFTVDRDIKHLFLTNLVIYMMYMEASWQIYNCVINSNISFDKGSISFGEWWCLQVPHQVDGGKNAHSLRFHSMTDSVERKRIKTWSHPIISTCFFFYFFPSCQDHFQGTTVLREQLHMVTFTTKKNSVVNVYTHFACNFCENNCSLG